MSTEEERQHFVCRIKDYEEDFYGIWYTGDIEGVATESGKMLLWRSEDEARNYARQRQWAMAPDEPATFDLDYILVMKADPSRCRPKDCLDLWNLFIDIGRSLDDAEFSRQDINASELHARLSAISLSNILGTEKEQLTATEIEKMMAVLCHGKAMLKQRRTVLG
jgi:hypothetical protein